MKTIVIIFLFIASCMSLEESAQDVSILSLYQVNQGDTLIINTSDLIGHTLTFVEYEDERGCSTGCDINKIVRKIEYDKYSLVYDPNRYHGVLIDGDLVECISRKEEH